MSSQPNSGKDIYLKDVYLTGNLNGILSKSNLGQIPNHGQANEQMHTVKVIEKACPCCKLWKKNKLQVDEVKDSSKPFHCEVCNKSFRQEAHLKAHLRVHQDDRPFSCETCGKHFRSQTSYKLHQMIHNGEKAFGCTVCSKRFRQKTHLKSHMLIHTREKPFVCYVCSKGFGLSSRLKTHLRVHTNEKPYDCPICGKSFRQKSHVDRHLKSHNKDPVYSVCQIGGNNVSNANHHMATSSKNDHWRNNKRINHVQPPAIPQPILGMHHSQLQLQIPHFQRH